MVSKFGVFIAVVVAAPFAVVFGLVLITIQSTTAPIFEAVSVSGPGGVGKDVIDFGGAWAGFLTAGLLSIPASIALYLLIGGRGEAKPVRRGRI